MMGQVGGEICRFISRLCTRLVFQRRRARAAVLLLLICMYAAAIDASNDSTDTVISSRAINGIT